ncbi:hypothetical protein [Modestobacter lapidis]|nr:hypothetical protein [Modestobacter lapidis]
MTAPDTRGPSDGPVPGSPDLNPFATAEKLMAQWEARHAVAAAGRRVVGPGVPQYLSHERCTEARSSTGPHGDRAAHQRAQRQHRPAPDVRPHFTDLFAWMVPVQHHDDPLTRPDGPGR